MDISVSTADGSAQLLYIIVVAPVVFLVVAVRVALRRYRISKRIRSQIIIAEYEPPHEITPAELGVLYDGIAGYRELYATYLDLQRRGIIKQVSDGKIQKFELVDSADLTQLKRHEVAITDMITSGVFTLPSRSDVVYAQLFAREVDKTIAERLQINMRGIAPHVLSIIRLVCLLTAWMLGVFFVYAIVSSGELTLQQLFDAVPFLMLAGLLIVIVSLFWIVVTAVVMHIVFGMLFGRLWIFGRGARKLWVEAEGYRQYLKQAELGRLRFESDDIAARAKKSSYAYAVALGLDVPMDEKA